MQQCGPPTEPVHQGHRSNHETKVMQMGYVRSPDRAKQQIGAICEAKSRRAHTRQPDDADAAVNLPRRKSTPRQAVDVPIEGDDCDVPSLGDLRPREISDVALRPAHQRIEASDDVRNAEHSGIHDVGDDPNGDLAAAATAGEQSPCEAGAQARRFVG